MRPPIFTAKELLVSLAQSPIQPGCRGRSSTEHSKNGAEIFTIQEETLALGGTGSIAGSKCGARKTLSLLKEKYLQNCTGNQYLKNAVIRMLLNHNAPVWSSFVYVYITLIMCFLAAKLHCWAIVLMRIPSMNLRNNSRNMSSSGFKQKRISTHSQNHQPWIRACFPDTSVCKPSNLFG